MGIQKNHFRILFVSFLLLAGLHIALYIGYHIYTIASISQGIKESLTPERFDALKTTPNQSRAITAVKQPTGNRTQEIAFSFIRLLIDDTAIHKRDNLKNGWHRLTYADGRIFVVMGNLPGMLGATNADETYKANATSVWGRDSLSAEYEFTRKILSARPDDINLFGSISQAKASQSLISMKSAYVSPHASAGYICHIERINCIHMGNPASDRLVFVHLFDAVNTRHQLMFNHFTQQQIDHILATARSLAEK